MKTIAQLIARRRVLKGMAASSTFGLFGCATGASTAADGSAALDFTELGRSNDDKAHVAPGYDIQVLLRHGDPIRRGGPAFRPGRQTGDEQEQQFGSDNDFIAFMPLPRGSQSSTRGLLGVNHENHRAALIWPGMTSLAKMTREHCEVSMAAQGFSIVEVEKSGNAWRVVDDSRYNRRISARTPLRASGPAAGHPRMRTREDPTGTRPVGTFNNCAGGVTPWNTILTAEENFQLYFGPSARYPWGRFFDRFNVEREPNEPNRFGWIVEIDPYDPQSTPVKRTALGRCSHECATCVVSHDGRVAVYSGDDARGECVYKFVTKNTSGRDMLDEGTLYVARFEASGKMRWLPLVHGQGPLTQANGFASQADVMIDLRRASRLLGGTPMDRPEDVEAHPASGRIYVVCTFNERRKPEEVNAANPRGPNPYGHIIEIVPPLVGGKPDHTATECEWGFFLLAGNPQDPKHAARYANPVSSNGWLEAPDNVAFDPKGRIWISTDGQDDAVGFNDSLYAAATSGPARGATRGFFNGPAGSEICGPCFTPDGRTLFLAVQHPGDGSSFEMPSTRWPDFAEGVPPRSAVVAVTRKDGGEIGG